MFDRALPAAVLAVTLFCPLVANGANTWYVDDDAPRGGDGTSWVTAFRYLQDAFAAATPGDEIRVAGGVYTPDRDEAGNAIPGDRSAAFRLLDRVAIKGGYAGAMAPDPDERHVNFFATVLSGDLNGDDGPNGENQNDNTYRIVTFGGTTSPGALEGVTVVGDTLGRGISSDRGRRPNEALAPSRPAPAVDPGGSRPASKSVQAGSRAAFRGSAAGLLFVDCNAPGPVQDGQSWCSAFTTLQGALAVASASGGLVTEIRVADGTHNPDQDASHPDGSGDRNALFHLLNGVALRGGYAGCGATDPDERDIGLFETTLSGDLAEDDGLDFTNRTDNSYGILWAENVDRSTVLDGFTIASGYAPSTGGGPPSTAAGIFIICAGPTITECTFRGHWARFGGSAIFAAEPGSTLLLNCRFMGNVDQQHGAVFTTARHAAMLVNCSFFHNEAGTSGGGMGNAGGATPTLVNCFFSGNLAARDGGGVWNINNAHATLINCTISGNSARLEGGGVMSRHGNSGPSNATVINSILWENTDSNGNGEQAQVYTDTSTPVVDYCCVQGWTGALGGVGNIGDDPRLVDADGPDESFGTVDDDVHLSMGSPAIDAADNTALPASVTTDLDGNPRFIDDPDMPDTGNPDGIHPIVDMGAHEFQPADLCIDDDGDGRVTICHVPRRNPNNAHTITVSVNALPAHLAHGDDCGPCEGDVN
ncbi:MAG: hypothetical protein IID40_03245 [Planctomycetes bacterium]|nr:hypothetical protein [Planctomycetota bacterium]